MSRTVPRLPVIIILLWSVLLATFGAGMLFSVFMGYDDAGYVLYSLREFIVHGSLYHDVYSQYGPFYYVVYYLIHLTGLPVDHNVGFSVRVIEWTGAALFAARVVWKGTGSLGVAVTCLSSVFVYLWMMVGEPIHPGGMIAFLTAALAGLGYDALVASNLKRWAVVAGVGVAALGLIKINIGIFAGAAVGAVLLMHFSAAAVRRAAPWIVACALAAMPFALMHTLLETRWVMLFAVLFALSATLAVVAASRASHAQFRWIHLAAMLAAGLAVTVLVVTVVLVKGSELRDVWQGVVLRPMRQPALFTAEYKWSPWALFFALFSACLLPLILGLNRGRGSPRMIGYIVSMLRIAAGAALVAAMLTFPRLSPDHLVMSFFAPCLWFFIWPLQNEPNEKTIARGWLGFLLLGQWLHAYPVPGSQIGWGTFLVIPLALLGVWEAYAWLSAEAAFENYLRRLGRVVGVGLFVLSGFFTYELGRIGYRYFESRSLALPGAELLRPPDSSISKYQIMCLNAAAHADVLFSLPGMLSYNVWTTRPTPTLANVTHWYDMLNGAEQTAILESLKTHERSCVILSRRELQSILQRTTKPQSALFDYVLREYAPAFTIDDTEFRVRRGRRIVGFNTATMFQYRGAEGPYDLQLEMRILLPRGTKVASIEIAPMDGFPGPTRVLRRSDCRIEMAALNRSGESTSPLVAADLPVTIERPSLVQIYFKGNSSILPANSSWIILRGEDGAEAAYIRFVTPFP